MEDVCLQHLEHSHVNLKVSTGLRVPCQLREASKFKIKMIETAVYLLVKKLLRWLSGFQELFAVKHPMFIVQMTSNIPVIYTHIDIYIYIHYSQ